MNWMQHPLVKDITEVGCLLTQNGWAEAFAGNISVWLTQEQTAELVLDSGDSRWFSLPEAVPSMANEMFLISASGAMLRALAEHTEQKMGVIQLDNKGERYRVLAGFNNSARPTSELITHLKVLASREDDQRVVIHTHATALITMSLGLKGSSEDFSKWLWSVSAEAMYFYPDGVGVCPWAVAGSVELGEYSAQLAKKHRLILWPAHGVLALGTNLNTALGLIETADKAAEIYCQLLAMNKFENLLNEDQLLQLAQAFSVSPQFNLGQ